MSSWRNAQRIICQEIHIYWKVCKYEEENDLPEEALACDVTPKVTRYEDKYYVSCCYWSEFGGLIRELVEIKIENNKVTEFLDANPITA